ncbi:ABC-2 type transport system permease protein [Kineococcus xinjiangensis]|uniref:Transport permease protein n=1 Tax=Kineococcus xinjiangensis TaxID=512762 RepID=A0A2S6IU28_9ACTN|nr:ABC transporter permease [Kineococcus xinjiangensis]PPK97754.1 ABC-2 type transport system permease protein [Kineococcus xinjiangensis]
MTGAPAGARPRAGEDGFEIPGRGRGLLDVLQRRYLLRLLVRKELRVRYQGSALGLLWSYVKPAVQFCVFFFALGVFLKVGQDVENFAVYLFAGIVVINYFSETFGNATRAVVGNAPLVKKIYLPRELFPVASAWVAAVHFLPQFVVLLIGTLIAGWRPTLGQLAGGALGFAIIVVLAVGLGLLFGAINVLYRDFENIVDLLLLVVTWTSPVLYTWVHVRDAIRRAELPDWLLTVYQLNPVTSAVELFHYGFWYGATTKPYELPPNLLWNGLLSLGIAVAVLVLGQFTFRRLEGRFAQEL